MLLNVTDQSNESLQSQIIRQIRARILSGEIAGHESEPGASWFDLDVEAASIEALTGQTLFAVAEDGPHGYAMREIRRHGSGVRVFTKLDHTGFEARPASRFEIPVTSCWEHA